MRPGMAMQPVPSIVSISTPARPSALPSAPIASIRPEAIRIDRGPSGSGAKTSAFSTSSIDSFGRTLDVRPAQLFDQAARHIDAIEEVDDQIVRLRGLDRQAQRGLFIELDHVVQTFRAKRVGDDRGDFAG